MPDLSPYVALLRAAIRWLTEPRLRCCTCGQCRRIGWHHACQWPGLLYGSLVPDAIYHQREAPEWCPRKRDV